VQEKEKESSSTSQEVKEKEKESKEKEHAQIEGIYYFVFQLFVFLAHRQSRGDVTQPPLPSSVPPPKSAEISASAPAGLIDFFSSNILIF